MMDGAPATGNIDPHAGAADLDAFVRGSTVETTVALTPGIRLFLAADPLSIFQDADEFERTGVRWPPFWAFAWPGGQALAAYLLANPSLVADRAIVDIGAGSGISSLAALRAGARSALAADVDPLAEVAAHLNAQANGLSLETTTRDLLGTDVRADMILIGDLVYEPELMARVTSFLERARRRGTAVLMADRTTARRPPLPFELVAEYEAPVTPCLEEGHFERARVWRLKG
jgi:predicted nicotinamide N-methyase